MPASLDHIHSATPMGANLTADGATFRVWAPSARRVHLVGDLCGWQPVAANALTRGPDEHWCGFWPGFTNGAEYKFWIEGDGSSGYKRDPYARELSPRPDFPHSNCIVRDPSLYPWRVANFRPPAFHEMLIYQLHIGAFFSPQSGRQPGTFFDVASKIPYLRDLGFNVVQLLPIQEFQTAFSLGYNGVDYFSPENNYALPDSEIPAALPRVNALLAAQNLPPLAPADLQGSANQLRCLVDLFHAHGIAVIFDVVYNHAGGDFGDESIYFFDRQPPGDDGRSRYFTARDESGGRCFDFGQAQVRQFLIDNAKFLFNEYRIDGLRHDHVRIIMDAAGDTGWKFCQDLNATCKFLRPDALQHAEFWPENLDALKPVWENGAGFDTCYLSGLRDRLREAIGQTSAGGAAKVNLTAVRDVLWPPGFPQAWRGVQNLETHDEVYRGRRPRIPRLADGADSRSWFARSRTRVATSLLLTAPGLPMIFMGQEFLEDKLWADDVEHHSDLRLYWDGLTADDPSMRDQLRLTRELAWLRRQLPGLTGEGFRAFHVHDENRVLAFHRWVPGFGADLIIVASLAETTYDHYAIGFPAPGRWAEVFNSDVHDRWVNPWRRGNGGSILADHAPLHEFDFSSEISIPANSVLVFAHPK